MIQSNFKVAVSGVWGCVLIMVYTIILASGHLNRYVVQFVGKNNLRDMDTEVVMQQIVHGMVGRRLLYKDLIA